jgi:hypothetical protein
MANAMQIIHPYKDRGTWVFDDERHGLVREPFVMGAGEMIDAVVKEVGLEHPERGFRLVFSAHEFPGHHAVLQRLPDEAGSGTWYTFADGTMKGWLCPALFHYFEKAPERIYARVEASSVPA